MVQQQSPTPTTAGATPKKVRILQNHRGHRLHQLLGPSKQSRALVYTSNCRCKPSTVGVLNKKASDSFDGSITPLKTDKGATDIMSRRRLELLLDNSDQFMSRLQSLRQQEHEEIENRESDDESDLDDDTSSMSDWE